MNKWFVYYDTDYDVFGFREFETKKEALDFINKQNYQGSSRNGNGVDINKGLILIEGRRIQLIPQEVITRIGTC